MSTHQEGFGDRPVPVRPLDEAQARLLDMLRAAHGQPVSFAELRSRGIENPAVLCYELEIAGLPITHVERSQLGGTPVPVGVKLDEDPLAAPEPPARPPASARLLAIRGSIAAATAATIARSRSLALRARSYARDARDSIAAPPRRHPVPREPRRGPRARAIAGTPALERARSGAVAGVALAASALVGAREGARNVASGLRSARTEHATAWDEHTRRTRAGLLLAATALAIVIALAVGLGSGSSAHRSAASRSAGAPREGSSASAAGHSAAAAARRARVQRSANSAGGEGASSSHAQRPPSEGAGRASQLQGEGHQLLVEGRYEAAATDLRKAIAVSGGSPARCQEPSSEACLAYAYALYDLGRALQAQHNPGAAVPILNERLRIDNQRTTVRAQLNSARRQMRSSVPRTVVHPHKHATAHHEARSPSVTHSHTERSTSTQGLQATGETPQPPTTGANPTGEGGEANGSPPANRGATGGDGSEFPPGGGTRG